MTERIQKILSARGVASRRKAEEMIKQGRVVCNGIACTLGQSVDPDIDKITIDGNPLPALNERVYLMLNKPRGFVTTLSDEKGRKNVAQLVENCGERVYPVGRLDMDSEGLLIFTNDGAFSDRLMHPSHEVNKTYLVRVSGWNDHSLSRLLAPMTLDGYRLRTPIIRFIKQEEGERAVVEITIHEGRNRQVRRMCAIAGLQVHRLRRIQEGSLKLGVLPVGKWRYLTEEEIDMLK